MTLKVGLIGAGGIANPHVKAFVNSEHVQQVFLADPSEDARNALTRQYGIIKRNMADYQELLTDPEINVIDICTPHFLHCPIAIEAMQAGKDVIIEKPLAISVDECDRMIQASEDTGRRLLCSLSQRRLPAFMQAKKLVDAGEIGRPFLAIVNIIGNEFDRMNDPESWKGDWDKAGGGALFDTGYHAVYMLQHFFGPAKTIMAMTKRLIVEPENKADDTSVVALELPGGVLANITVTYSATGDRWSEERRFIGTEGSILVRDNPEDEMPLVVLQGADFRNEKVKNPPGIHQYAVATAVEYLLDCIVTGAESEITLEEARAAVATVQAAYQSEREGRRIELAPPCEEAEDC